MSNKKFRILLIEDEIEISSFIKDNLKKVNERIDVIIVNNKMDAIEYLKNNDIFFDMISLDLQIPSNEGLLDKCPENGLHVLAEAKRYASGTPLVMLTGTSTIKMLNDFLRHVTNLKIWQDDAIYPTVSHYEKSDLDMYLDFLKQVYHSVLNLFNIEVNFKGDDSLIIEHDRLIRIFVKKVHGFKVEVKKIGGGLSSATVYSLWIYDVGGNLIHQTIAKCGQNKEIDEDSSNYDKFINRLDNRVTPRKLHYLKFGAKFQSGVFYSLATQYPYSYFESSKNNFNNVVIRKSIEDLTTNWQQSGYIEYTNIKSIRNQLVSDETITKLIKEFDLGWISEFEEIPIQINKGICHCDLHGENILINMVDNCATLIDYGDIKELSLTIDPLTLECSFLFHPNGIKDNWSTIEDDIKNWNNVEKYVENSPIKEEILFCREWLNKLKYGNREVGATLYAYALRQLKYPETNKTIALELITVARKIVDES